MNDLLLAFCESPLPTLPLFLCLFPLCCLSACSFQFFPRPEKKREAYEKCAAKEIWYFLFTALPFRGKNYEKTQENNAKAAAGRREGVVENVQRKRNI